MRSLAAGAAVLTLLTGGATAQTPYAAAGEPTPGASVCPDGLCGAEALEGLFQALAATEAGTRDRSVHILQIGDSHTAGDRITGALRARMQARFGRGGRGVLPPGVPYPGYAPFQVEVAATNWPTTVAPLVGSTGSPTMRAGLAGAKTLTRGAGARLDIVTEPGAAFSAVTVCGEGGPDAGALSLTTSAGEATADFAMPEAAPVCVSRTWPGMADRVTLRPERGAVTLHEVTLTREGPGVTVSALGQVGATLRDLAARDEAVAATELAAWRPGLIVLAFGTNEGFEDGLSVQTYEALLRGQIARLRRLAPAASLMLLGAPEALRGGQAGGCGVEGTRRAPAGLAMVRDVQRRVAAETGVAFWDWHGRMGGDCSAERLATMADPYMRPDRVHFTSAGSAWIGGVLSDDLLGAYDRWLAARDGAR